MSGILLKQRSAEERYDTDPPLQRVVPRGELVLEIPPDGTDGSPSHIYCLYSNNAIILYDDGTSVAPLEGAELDYLLAITDPQKRIAQYLESGKLKWIMNLKHGDTVSFRLPQGSNAVLMPRGRLRYYGRIPRHEGVMFGLEILDRDCKGKGSSDGSPHFQCGCNNAVYVPMDKIIKLNKTADDPIKELPKPSAGTRSKTERKDKSLLEQVKETLGMGAAPVAATIRPPADYHSRFSIDDRVVIQTAQGVPVKGWVRWVGPVKMSRSAGGITVSALGIETSRPIDHEAEFPGLNYGVTSQMMFKVPPNHGRIFLAEQLVLLEEEYRQHNTGAATKDDKHVPIGPEGTVHLSEESLLKQQQEYVKLEGQHNSQRPRDKQKQQNDEPLVRMLLKADMQGPQQKFQDDKHALAQQKLTKSITVTSRPRAAAEQLVNHNDSMMGALPKMKQEIKALQDAYERTLENKEAMLVEKESTLVEKEETVARKETALVEKETALVEKEATLVEKEATLVEKEATLVEKEATLVEKEATLVEKEGTFVRKERVLAEKEKVKGAIQVEKEATLLLKEATLVERERKLAEKETVLMEMEKMAEKFAQSWIISHKDVSLTKKELGRGGWGYIRVGVFREQRVAVKQLYHIIMSDSTRAIMNREINTMSRLRHPNLLLFIGAVLDDPSDNPLIITEIMDTSLRNAYEKGQITEESVKLSILRDTASALNYLHCHPAGAIIHRDVSSANVLLETRGTNQWRAKLSDFGSANEARKAITQAPGAQVYAAPESLTSIVDDKEHLQTTKMDVYSYGIMVCELMTCQFPSSPAVFRSMLQSVSPSIRQVVQECVNKSPEKRPTMQQVIKSLDELINHK